MPKNSRGPQGALSADSLLRTASLHPIIASRGARPKPDPDLSLTPSRASYDDDATPVLMTYAHHPKTFVHRLDDNYEKAERAVPAVVYLQAARPRRPETPPGYLDSALDYDYYWLRPSPCYILLKFLEMMLCVAIIIVSRLGKDDLELDIVHTLFGVVGLAAAAISMMVLWVKGHPTPGDCLHTTMMLCYGITVPILLCGAILVLVQSDISSPYAPALCTLFFVSLAIFTLDVIVLAVAILRCACAQPFHSFRPQGRSGLIYPYHHPHHDLSPSRAVHVHRSRNRRPLYDSRDAEEYFDGGYGYEPAPRHREPARYWRIFWHDDRGPRLPRPHSGYPGDGDLSPHEVGGPDPSGRLPSKPRMYVPPHTARTWTSETVPGQRRY